jgi:UDP-N-acetylmuramoyl-L-alanyl-D-glutamate--2,6-diaminopimelate ligase
VFNRDDRCGREWASVAADRVVLYGIGGDLPEQGEFMLATDLQSLPQGLALDLKTRSAQASLQAPLLGRFNAHNLLAAAAALVENGVDLADAARALAASWTVPGRMEAFSGPNAQARVVVDYAHTPQALTHALKALREHTPGQLWCVFGCGGDRDVGKRPLMGAAAAEFADHIVLTDDNPRSETPADIVAAIRQGIPAERAVEIIHERASAIEWAIRRAGPEDVVLVAGKGHEEEQRYGRESRAFSDRRVVADLLGSGVAP